MEASIAVSTALPPAMRTMVSESFGGVASTGAFAVQAVATPSVKMQHAAINAAITRDLDDFFLLALVSRDFLFLGFPKALLLGSAALKRYILSLVYHHAPANFMRQKQAVFCYKQVLSLHLSQ